MTQPNWTEKARWIVVVNDFEAFMTKQDSGRLQKVIKTALQEAYEQGVEDSAKVAEEGHPWLDYPKCCGNSMKMNEKRTAESIRKLGKGE